jgi:hypothetical protein
MKNITEHFTDLEFQLGKELTDEELNKAYLFCLFILEPVRNRFGPVRVTDFKRTDADTQRLIEAGYGPSKTSQHLQCEAVDFTVHNSNLREVFNFIVTELKWQGQVELDLLKYHLHVGFPRLGIAGNKFVRGTSVQPT